MTSSIRHRLAAVALALALPAGSAVLAANPALLATTADGGLPIGGGGELSGPVFTGSEPTGPINTEPFPGPIPDPLPFGPNQAVVDQAKADTRTALTNETCRFLVSGATPRKPAREALDDAAERNMTDQFDPADTPTRQTVASAQVNGTLDGQGNLRDVLRYYRPFLDPGPIETVIDTTRVTVTRRFTDLTPQRRIEIIRAIVLLHEVAHLTRANTHPDGDPDREFNTRIIVACFTGLVSVLDATPPPTGSNPPGFTPRQLLEQTNL